MKQYILYYPTFISIFFFRKESRKWREPPEKALRFENLIIQETNLPLEQIEESKKMLGDALQLCGIENEIASFMKRKFDAKYGKD
ncbi:hypothetical protein GCK72_012278 [Caenorhabditis remanei]|uniref:Uncharacterized protein n=1 Tax=Caenorhabditis remanei TaxID=31234 RepID=A0A6A5GKJ3_CAERE|nr:hypothetical protein GCK72_012278 [Caenorhabditis remanei]KAF1755828.1 hypothetical protein GCK72_012278 [Caenorhabditis remanei]